MTGREKDMYLFGLYLTGDRDKIQRQVRGRKFSEEATLASEMARGKGGCDGPMVSHKSKSPPGECL